MHERLGNRTGKARIETATAAVAILAARICINFLKFGIWRNTLGEIMENERISETDDFLDKADLATALRIANRVERAAWRMPGEVKCFPKAIAVQWILRGRGIPSKLVVAMKNTDLTAEHDLHAWVECGDQMVIGRCERDDYRQLMAFTQGGSQSAGVKTVRS